MAGIGVNLCMAPGHSFMDSNLDVKPVFPLKVAPGVESRTPVPSSNGKSLRDVRVDIIECNSNIETVYTSSFEDQDPEATECSSSFADTTSDAERLSELSDPEVESQCLGGDAFVSSYDAASTLFHARKKKLTDQWRNFIRPLMWRCKWTELRIKEIESQALKYTREIETYDLEKLSEFKKSSLEGFGSKSLPLTNQCLRRKTFMRKRRKRIEDAMDVTSYMKQHNLFAYLENRKSNPDYTNIVDDFANQALMERRADSNDKLDTLNGTLLFEFKDGDASLEKLLQKLQMVHTRVQKLKGRMDMVMSKNASKFSSSENLSLLALFDAQTSSGPSPTFSAGNTDTVSVGGAHNTTHHLADYDMKDLGMPESAISSYGEAFHVPDIIESTVGLLSSADVTFHQAQIGDSCEDIVDNMLIESGEFDRESKSVLQANKYAEVHEQEKGKEKGRDNVDPSSSIPVSEPGQTKAMASQEKSGLRSCLASDIHFPRNKRTRGDRKASSGTWSKKQSSDPDSQ